MICKLENKVMNYDWGTFDYIPNLLSVEADGLPQAELWMGAHLKAPSIADGQSLGELISKMRTPELSFLMKVLSAKEALSIQAHPKKKDAVLGFERESKLGLDIDHDKRSYKDSNEKPELAIALTEFWGLVGFRMVNEIVKMFRMMCLNSFSREIDDLEKSGDLRVFFEALLNHENKGLLIRESVECSLRYSEPEFSWIVGLANKYPGDIGVFAPAYLNLIRLKPSEGIFLGPGVLHAYLKGTIIEIMGNSDNVLRGGLSSKYVDKEGLVGILEFEEFVPEIIVPKDGVYHTPAKEFELSVVGDGFHAESEGSEILFCLEGLGFIDSAETIKISRGDSFYVSPGTRYRISDNVIVYRARQL